MKKLVLLLALVSSSIVFAFEPKTIQEEWENFHRIVSMLRPDGQIGGYAHYKDFEDVQLIWRTQTPSGNEYIRFFREKKNGQYFAVTYYLSFEIIPNKVVLRKTFETAPNNFLAFTIDEQSGRFYGRQGNEEIETSDSDELFLNRWKIAGPRD